MLTSKKGLKKRIDKLEERVNWYRDLFWGLTNYLELESKYRPEGYEFRKKEKDEDEQIN